LYRPGDFVQFVDDPDLLSDPRSASGYRYVSRRQRANEWRAEFHHGGRAIRRDGFPRPSAAASWVILYFRERYGDSWFDWLKPARKREPGKLSGPGWVIRPIADDEYLLEVCPCGVWCGVEYTKNGRKADIFPDERAALKALDSLHKTVWPLFGKKILDAAPYRTPRRMVTIPASIG
jgi:hypothetical protein